MQHHALGVAGGARREEDVGRGRRASTASRSRVDDRGVDGRARGEERRPSERRAGGRVAAQDDDRLEVGELGRRRRPRRAASARSRCRGSRVIVDERRAPRLARGCTPPRALEPGVERHEHAAGRLQAERGDDPLPAVRRPDRDPVAGLDPRGEEHRAPRRRQPRRARRRTGSRPSLTSTIASCAAEALGRAAHEAGRRPPFEIAANARFAHGHPPSPDLTARQLPPRSVRGVGGFADRRRRAGARDGAR